MENWVLFTARRYLLTHSGRKGHLGNILAVLGLTIGIMTLLTVLTVMNGFQQGFITSINEVYSYHLRITPEAPLTPGETEELSDLKNIRAVVTFYDLLGILTSADGFSGGAQLRFIDPEAMDNDTGFMDQIEEKTGSFNLSEKGDILLGHDLARSLNAVTGDTISLSYLDARSGNASLKHADFRVAGTFRTGYFEYDRSMAFTAMDGSFPASADPVTGIKLKNHFHDLSALQTISETADLSDGEIVSWRTYNSAFFNALKVEKIFMLLVVGLIFIVVAVNIYHSMKRSVRERLEELALLKAMGSTPSGIRKIFLFQGIIIALTGCAAGTLLGLLVSSHVNEIMDFFIGAVQAFRLLLFRLQGGEAVDFTPSLFYFTDIPVKVMVQDLVVVNAAAFLSVVIAASGSVRTLSGVMPAEIFRNE